MHCTQIKHHSTWQQLLAIIIFFCRASLSTVIAGNISDAALDAARLHYAGKLESAHRLLSQAARQQPDEPFVFNQLGLVSAKLQRYEAAGIAFRRALQLDAANTHARRWLGILALIEGDIPAARRRFEETLQRDSQDADALYFLGAIAGILRDDDGATRYLMQSRDADAGEAETHYRLGVAFERMDLMHSALAEYQRTLEINPRYVRAMDRLGWLYYNQDNTDTALNWWKRALTLNRRDQSIVFSIAKAYNDLGYTARRRGDITAARNYWQQTLRYKPDDKAARWFLQHDTQSER